MNSFLIYSSENAMNKLLVVLFGLVAAANAVSFFDLVKEEWHAFKVRSREKSIFLSKNFDIK